MVNEKILAIAKLIKIDGVTEQEIIDSIAVPSDASLGDYCLPCFKFSKIIRKSPQMIANDLVNSFGNLTSPLVSANAVNGYINFYTDKLFTAKKVIGEILQKNENYGNSDIGKGATICIDYSSINIAKPFHIGHLCTTVIGGSLYKIYKKLGYNLVGINHLGDWGTQFGKLIVAFKKWSSEEELKARGMKALTEIYVKYHEESEKDASLDDKAREWFKKIEENDEEALRLFNIFKEVTIKEVGKTYDRLKITFDSYNGESFYNDKMQPVIDKLQQKQLLTESEGAKIVDLSEYGMPPCLIVKADGATLYATRDLAAAYYRKNTYNFEKCLYVVAYQQNLHFKQWFKVIELLGEPWYKSLVHVPFGMVSLEDGAMSTRKGKVVLLEDALNKAVEKSLVIIEQKSPDLEGKEEVAEMVGVGAIIFSALYNNRIKDIVFSYDKVLNFDGETGPYIQYTNARCNSVLEKLGSLDYEKADFDAINNPEGNAVIAALEAFPKILTDAIEKYEPCYVARYLVNLCQEFNRFYYAHRILNEKESVVIARAMLVKCTHVVIEEGLRLLGISAPKKM
ncbi:MAG TPA: arginine--tRNA ligase [Clostridia bacterium]|nr:arginine--tRNA ligase [Clostridia bacterium]